MQIDVSDLRTVTEKLFNHLDEIGQSSIELTNDYYWDISEDERYNVENDPQDLSIGQLTEDWEFLRKIGMDDEHTIAYAFVWLGKILQAIGETVVH
mgnify:CR=1 FL=1